MRRMVSKIQPSNGRQSLWRRPMVFWSVTLGLLLLVALFLGYGKWAFELLRSFRTTSSKGCTVESEAPRQDVLSPLEVLTVVPLSAAPLARTNELEAHAALERLMKSPFVKVRPRWLTNPRTGRALECDCYSAEHRLCVEVNGRQHVEYVPYFHRTVAHFHDQLFRDELKRSLLRKHGDTLIIVSHSVRRKDIQAFLARELQRQGFKLPGVSVG
jgi:hypothetical protein